MLIRPADPERDAAACLAIYAPFVAGSAVSFEEVPPTEPEFTARIERLSGSHAFLVAEDDAGAVAGFAYGGPHRERAAYRWATEVSVYLDAAHRGQRLGTRLYAALSERLVSRGYRVALAGITLPNAASVALHESCGFTRVGAYERIGFKAGAWRDVLWLTRQLVPDSVDDDPPAQPR
jgi:phosphinothricin acetyltransferase